MQHFVNRQPSCSEKMVRFPKKKSFSRDQRGLGRHRVLLHAQRKSEFTAARHAVLSLKGYRETGNVRSDQVQHVLKKSFNTKSCVLIGRKCLSDYGAVPGDLRAPGMASPWEALVCSVLRTRLRGECFSCVISLNPHIHPARTLQT